MTKKQRQWVQKRDWTKHAEETLKHWDEEHPDQWDDLKRLMGSEWDDLMKKD